MNPFGNFIWVLIAVSFVAIGMIAYGAIYDSTLIGIAGLILASLIIIFVLYGVSTARFT